MASPSTEFGTFVFLTRGSYFMFSLISAYVMNTQKIMEKTFENIML